MNNYTSSLNALTDAAMGIILGVKSFVEQGDYKASATFKGAELSLIENWRIKLLADALKKVGIGHETGLQPVPDKNAPIPTDTLIEYPHYTKWQNKDGFWEVKRVLDDAGKYNYLCECADEKIAAKICDDWNTQVQQREISVIEADVQHAIHSALSKTVAEAHTAGESYDVLEAIRPYLKREIGYRAGENVPSRDHNFAELIAVPVEQMNDIHRHLRNLIALGQTHIKDFDTQPKEITDLKGKIFAEAESAVLFAGNWATRNRKPTEIEGGTQRESVEDKIAKLLHYPAHWDIMAYPTLYDAVNEIHNGCSVCKEPEAYTAYHMETKIQEGK